MCCSPWGHKESDTTEQLNNKNKDRSAETKLVVAREGCEEVKRGQEAATIPYKVMNTN